MRLLNKNNFIIGKAILTFKNLKVNKTFNITNKYFGIHKSQLPFHFNIDSSRFIINNSNIRLKYNKVDTTSLFSNTLNPFLFKDLNLDNKKELILVYTGSGQRHVSEFKPYSISLSNKFITAKSIKIPPFDKLDEMSVLSPDKRTITIHESNGSCKGIDKFFIFNPYNKDTPFVYSYLTKEVAFNHSTGKCITKTFKIK